MATCDYGVAGKTALSKLLVGKFGLGEGGSFLWTTPSLKTPTLLDIK
jgi:hypothetical protein